MAATKNAARCSTTEISGGTVIGHHENGGGRGQYRLKPNEDWEDGNLSRPKNEHESREIERERNDP